MNRRDCIKSITAAGTAVSLPQILPAANDGKFAIDYVLASTLYGNMKLDRILPELGTYRSGRSGYLGQASRHSEIGNKQNGCRCLCTFVKDL